MLIYDESSSKVLPLPSFSAPHQTTTASNPPDTPIFMGEFRAQEQQPSRAFCFGSGDLQLRCSPTFAALILREAWLNKRNNHLIRLFYRQRLSHDFGWKITFRFHLLPNYSSPAQFTRNISCTSIAVVLGIRHSCSTFQKCCTTSSIAESVMTKYYEKRFVLLQSFRKCCSNRNTLVGEVPYYEKIFYISRDWHRIL